MQWTLLTSMTLVAPSRCPQESRSRTPPGHVAQLLERERAIDDLPERHRAEVDRGRSHLTVENRRGRSGPTAAHHTGSPNAERATRRPWMCRSEAHRERHPWPAASANVAVPTVAKAALVSVTVSLRVPPPELVSVNCRSPKFPTTTS